MRHHRTAFDHDLSTTHSAFSAFDRDGSGEINYTEFEAAMCLFLLYFPLFSTPLCSLFKLYFALYHSSLVHVSGGG